MPSHLHFRISLDMTLFESLVVGLGICTLLLSPTHANRPSLKSSSSQHDNIPQNTNTPPNIVILFADNLGYNDISFFGAPTAKTPNIDRLGFEGIKLNNWNSAAALCSASRAALLTGKYPVRTGVFPRVFKPDSVYGLLPTEKTLAEYLREDYGYATSIVGKWHLGQRSPYLPTDQGFDEWIGVPYHMSGGSIDEHICSFDANETMWLPLYENTRIKEQPVRIQNLARRYGKAASDFIHRNSQKEKPFLLYLAFSHVHQMCAPKFGSEQGLCQWAGVDFSETSPHATFADAVEEMDWVAGQALKALDEAGVTNDTLVIFTSDNGPWVAEQECSGSKGPFEGRWLQENVDQSCTACPHDYIPSPTSSNPRRCIIPQTSHEIQGVHCGADTGLGGTWEANLRMPALARWPGRIPAGVETMSTVSTLDVLPTVLSIVEGTQSGDEVDKTSLPDDLDGIDITDVLFGKTSLAYNDNSGNEHEEEDRVLFFWRDGFSDGPLPQPYGRFDVSAMKIGRIKAWFYTKSAHYNSDAEVFHDPPLLFDVWNDPAEAYPLDPENYEEIVVKAKKLVKEHKEKIDWGFPLGLDRDPKYQPCVNPRANCRTTLFPPSEQDTRTES